MCHNKYLHTVRTDSGANVAAVTDNTYTAISWNINFAFVNHIPTANIWAIYSKTFENGHSK